MGILTWIIFGVIAGAIAKWLVPGKDPGGIFITMLIGIVGAVVGGYIGTYLGFGSVSGFNLRSFAVAIGGAVVLLLAYRLIRK